MNSMSLKQKLKNNKLTLGSWITISNPLIPEILSPAGFDWLCVDLEHTSIVLNELLPIIISIENQKMTPLVRVGENNPNLIKRVMDIGAHGVIVPNISTAVRVWISSPFTKASIRDSSSDIWANTLNSTCE